MPLGVDVAAIDTALVNVVAIDAAHVDVADIDAARVNVADIYAAPIVVADVYAARVDVTDMDVAPSTWFSSMWLMGSTDAATGGRQVSVDVAHVVLPPPSLCPPSFALSHLLLFVAPPPHRVVLLFLCPIVVRVRSELQRSGGCHGGVDVSWSKSTWHGGCRHVVVDVAGVEVGPKTYQY